jgi:hypothetical protein
MTGLKIVVLQRDPDVQKAIYAAGVPPFQTGPADLPGGLYPHPELVAVP